MDILLILKQAADIGLTAPVIFGVTILWQINKKFTQYDVRLSVLESYHNRRKTDTTFFWAVTNNFIQTGKCTATDK